MTIEQLRALHGAKPVRPFTIRLADSRNLTVRHPEQLAISPSGRTIGVAHSDDTIETIDLLLVGASSPRRMDLPADGDDRLRRRLDESIRTPTLT